MQFRKWKKPSVRKGTRIRTEMGVVEIIDISETQPGDMTDREAVSAGFENLDQLLDDINSTTDGQIYKIELRYHSEDPRIALRQNTDVSDKDLQAIKLKLDRLDRYGNDGAWTRSVLKLIQENPRLRAADLANMMSKEKDALKLDIRKLKNLGLTISHKVGYTLSPRGEIVLTNLKES